MYALKQYQPAETMACASQQIHLKNGFYYTPFTSGSEQLQHLDLSTARKKMAHHVFIPTILIATWLLGV